MARSEVIGPPVGGASSIAGARPQARTRAVLLVLLGAALLSALFGLWVGEGALVDPELGETFLRLRAARMVVAFLAGAALAVGGVLVQGLFRNPLASPSIVGTTAGASLGGQSAMLAFQLLLGGQAPAWMLPEMVLPLGCVVGAVGALLLLLSIARFHGDLVVLLLTGFLLSSLFLSIGSFLTRLAQESWELGRAVLSFTLGSVAGSGVRQVLLALPLTIVGILAAWRWAGPLDLMLSGEEEAQSLGVDVARVRLWAVVWTGLLTAAAVSVGGNVGFVGLIVPHALRPFLGARHRRLVPAAALGGGTFLILCDLLSRAVVDRGEVPLGVITGLIGAPLFLALLMRSRRLEAHG